MFRRFLPRTDAFTLFARPGHAPLAPPAVPTGYALSDCDSATSPLAAPLDQFCHAQGFPQAWATEMLEARCRAVIVHDDAGQIVAMAWTTTQPFYVDEVHLTLVPPADCPYLFGDFVSPPARGRRLQSALVAHRLALFPARDAVTLIHPANTASVRSYQSHHFAPVAALKTRQWFGRTKTRNVRQVPNSPFTTTFRRQALTVSR